MADPDQQRLSKGGDIAFYGAADRSSYLKARTALTVYQAQDKQLAIQKRKGRLVERARAEALVFRLAHQERDTWVTWPSRVAALMAADLAAEVEKQTSTPVIIEAAILQRVLEAQNRLRGKLTPGDKAERDHHRHSTLCSLSARKSGRVVTGRCDLPKGSTGRSYGGRQQALPPRSAQISVANLP